MLRILKQNRIRHSLSLCIALIAGCIVNHFYALTDGYLIPLMAMFVMLTAVGCSVYQGLMRFALIMVIVALPALALYSMHFLYMEMHDVLIGAVIGIAANIIILPRRTDMEYRDLIKPVFQSYQNYFQIIVEQLLLENPKGEGNAALEKSMLTLPSWVFDRGFDSGLQTGYRFFLVKLEQVGDMLFAMHQLARINYDPAIIDKIRIPLQNCTNKINQFFTLLTTVFELKKITEKTDDFADDIAELEKQYNTLVPLSIEYLEIEPQFVSLAEFIYYLKDLRDDLLKLAESLRQQ